MSTQFTLTDALEHAQDQLDASKRALRDEVQELIRRLKWSLQNLDCDMVDGMHGFVGQLGAKIDREQGECYRLMQTVSLLKKLQG